MPPTTWFDLKVPEKKNRPTKSQWDTIEYFRTRDKILGITDSQKIKDYIEKQKKLNRKNLKRKRINDKFQKLLKDHNDKKLMPPPPPVLPGTLKRCNALPHKKKQKLN